MLKPIIAFTLLLLSLALASCEKENEPTYYVRYEAHRELPNAGGLQIRYTTAEGKSQTVKNPDADYLFVTVGPVRSGFLADLYASGYGSDDPRGVSTRISVCMGSEPFVLKASHGGKDFLNSKCQYRVGR